MWRELFSQRFTDVEFYPPVTNDAIKLAQSKIGLLFPQDLNELYLETNGIYFTDAYMWIVWSVDDLTKRNLYMHNSPEVAFYEKSFKDLLFFGDLGNGDLLTIRANVTPIVGIWDHEDGEFRGNATSLREHFEKQAR